ncbi:MAG: nucleoside deaminase [Clostridia bacterium]
MNKYMQLAIKEAEIGIKKGHGGPFGAIIVKGDKIISSGHNMVVKKNNPICHGEIMAIQKACKKLNNFDLTGCEMYSTGEPCPMCLGAILWANIDKVYYGASIADNESIGFRDNELDNLLGGRANIPKNFMSQIDKESCIALFEKYNAIKDKIHY